MNHFTQHAELGHVQGSHLEKVVGAIFEHHAVFAGLFGDVDEFPAVGDRSGSRNFHGHVFAMLHGINSHLDVRLPVGADINEVDIVALAKFFICCRTNIFSGSRQSFGFQNATLNLLHILRKEVAQSHNLNAVDISHTVNGVRTTHSKADKADAYIFNRLGSKFKHTRLIISTLRLVENDKIIFNLVVFARDTIVFTAAHHDDEKHDYRCD